MRALVLFCLLLAAPAFGQTPQRVGPLYIQNNLAEIAAAGSAAQAAARANLGVSSAFNAGCGQSITGSTLAVQFGTSLCTALQGSLLGVASGVAGLDGGGKLPAAQVPPPTASTLGGVQSAAGASHQWISGISTAGVPVLSQPAFGDLTGTATTGQLPIGTSGATIPLLNGSPVWSGAVQNWSTGTGSRLRLDLNAAAGTLNSLVQAGDVLESFNAGLQNTGGLVIAPWANNGYGIRLDAVGGIRVGGPFTLLGYQYDPRNFGVCIWDGTHDVAPCINAAITALVTANTGNEAELVVPPLTMPLGSQITGASGHTLKIRGQGPKSVLLAMSTNNTNPRALSQNNGSIILRDLVIDGGGDSSTQTNPLVNFFEETNITLDNVSVQNTPGIGINISSSAEIKITNSNFLHLGNRYKTTGNLADRYQGIAICCTNVGFPNQDIQIIGNRLYDIGLDMISVGNSNNVVIDSNLFDTGQAAAIFSYGSSYANYSHNVISNIAGNCIDMPGISHGVIVGNVIRNCGDVGIGIFPEYDGANFTGSITGTTLSVTSAVTGPGAITVGQAVGDQSYGVLPQTYIISGSGTTWIVSRSQTVSSRTLYVQTTARYVTVEGNQIMNTQQSTAPGTSWSGAITIGPAGNDNIVIRNNHIGDDHNITGAAATTQYGITAEYHNPTVGSWTALPTNVSIVGNDIEDTLSGAYLGTPTTTVTGCSSSAVTGYQSGTFTSGVTGSCTPVLAIGGSAAMAAPVTWACSFSNQTTANLFRQTAATNKTITGAGTTVSGDVISYSCQPS